jgi:hypothetical protein
VKPEDLDRLTAYHARLEAELAAAKRERAAVAAMIDERRRLPVLPNIRMANPCPADWNAMRGDDRVRACATCDKNVYNLSAMTRADAEALIVSKHGDLCAQYWQRADGTIILSDCTVQLTRRRRTLAAFAAVTALAGAALAVHASEVPARPEPRPPVPVHVQLRRVDRVPSIVQPGSKVVPIETPPRRQPISSQPPRQVEQELEPPAQMMRGGIRLHQDPVIKGDDK